MQSKSYMSQIVAAQTAEEMAKLTAIALDNYSRKISEASICPQEDVVFMEIVLRQYADGFEKYVPAEMKGFMHALMGASKEAASEIVVKMPRP